MLLLRPPWVWVAVAAAAVVASAETACDYCGGVACDACAPALTLRVTDAATGEPVPGLTVYGADGSCEVQEDLGYTLCEVSLGVGTFDLTLTADGYEHLPIVVTINPDSGDSCCSCGYNSKIREEQLTPT